MSRPPGTLAKRAGRILVVTGVFGLALIGLARPVTAEDPERKNCPDGFIWVRMSGTACVQETVPTNARIAYDGHAICNDGWVGIGEWRPTKDGQGVPGNPATAFMYLKECVTPEEAERRRAAKPPGSPDDLSSLLAKGPIDKIPAEDLVVIGLTATGGIIVAVSRWKLPPRPGAAAAPSAVPPQVPPAPVTVSEEASEPAEPEPLPTDPAEIRRKKEELAAYEAMLAQLDTKIRAEADAGRLTVEDYVTWIGAVADLVGPWTGPGGPYVGAVSIAANLSQSIAESAGWTDVKSVYRDLRGRLADIARLRGMISADQEALDRALADAEKPPPTVPGRVDMDPGIMPDEMLRAEAERARARVDAAYDADRRMADAADRAREERRRRQAEAALWRQVMADFDRRRVPGAFQDVSSDVNAAANLAASLQAYAAQYGEDAANALARSAGEMAGRTSLAGLTDLAADHAAIAEDAGELAADAHLGGNLGSVVGGGTAVQSLIDWYAERGAEQQRVAIEHDAEGAARRLGEADQRVLRADQRTDRTTQAFRDEVARRHALQREIDRRAAAQGRLLWTPKQ